MPSLNRSDGSSASSQTSYVFEPDAEITAYELAKLLPILTAATKDPSCDIYQLQVKQQIILPSHFTRQIEELDEPLRRHFASR